MHLVLEICKRFKIVRPGRRFLAFHRGGSGPFEEVDVEPSVVVVIEKGDAGARGIDDGGFFGSAGTMVEFVEAGLPCDFSEDDGDAVNEAASSDGTGESVFDGSVNSAGGHAGGIGWSGRLRLWVWWR